MAAALALSANAAPADTAKDLVAIKAARSIVGEWALVNAAAASGRVTRVYARRMREKARRQLGEEIGAMTAPASPAARLMARLAALPSATPAGLLRRGAAALRGRETALESD